MNLIVYIDFFLRDKLKQMMLCTVMCFELLNERTVTPYGELFVRYWVREILLTAIMCLFQRVMEIILSTEMCV